MKKLLLVALLLFIPKTSHAQNLPLVQISHCTISAATCTMTFGQALVSGNLSVWACSVTPTGNAPTPLIIGVTAGGTLLQDRTVTAGTGQTVNTSFAAAHILPLTATGGTASEVVTLSASTTGWCFGAEAAPSASGSLVNLDISQALRIANSTVNPADNAVTLSGTNDLILKCFQPDGANVSPTAISSPYSTNAYLPGNNGGCAVAANPGGAATTWTAASSKPILITLAFGFSPTGPEETAFIDFEQGTQGAIPTAADLSASTHGANPCAYITEGAPGFPETLITYDTAASMPLLYPTGRLGGDGTTITVSQGTKGLTANWVSTTNLQKVECFISSGTQVAPRFPVTMTAFMYNDDFTTAGANIDCGNSHGTNDFAGLNCYRNGPGAVHFGLETPQGNGCSGPPCNAFPTIPYTPGTTCGPNPPNGHPGCLLVTIYSAFTQVTGVSASVSGNVVTLSKTGGFTPYLTPVGLPLILTACTGGTNFIGTLLSVSAATTANAITTLVDPGVSVSGSATGCTVNGAHVFYAYDKTNTLLGHLYQASAATADWPNKFLVGNATGSPSGGHSYWDSWRISFSGRCNPVTLATWPDVMSVQECINAASASQPPIQVLPGNETWTGGSSVLVSDNAVSMAGSTTVSNVGYPNTLAAGTAVDNTVITFSGGSNAFLGVTCPASGIVTLSGLTFKWAGGLPGTSAQSFLAPTNTIPTSPCFRFTNSHIVVSTPGSIVFSNSQYAYGLYDHILYELISGNPGMFSSHFDPVNHGHLAWQNSVALGSQQAIYIESSTFRDPAHAHQVPPIQNSEGPFDCYAGGRYVIRFSVIEGHDGGCHGTDSDNTRGAMLHEGYGNASTNDTDTGIKNTNDRSGTIFNWGNTYTISGTGSWSNMVLQNLRETSCPGNCGTFGSPAVGLYVQSSDPTTTASITTTTTPSAGQFCTPVGRDILIPSGNTSTCPSGDTAGFFDGPGPYPDRDQIGRIHGCIGGNQSQGQCLAPAYQWLNTGSNAFFSTTATVSIQECRDFYNYNASFTGACSAGNGVGSGTLAARPATCTTGVAYWATDQGSWNQSGNGFGQGQLYQCTSTNTWSLYYTPLTYPHPLVTGSGGGSPTFAIVNGTSWQNFPVLLIGQSVQQDPVIQNNGTANLVVSSITITGTNASDFSFAAQGCPLPPITLAPTSNCNILLSFSPSGVGLRTAVLTFVDNAPTSPQTFNLIGTVLNQPPPANTIFGALNLGGCPACAGPEQCFCFTQDYHLYRSLGNSAAYLAFWNPAPTPPVTSVNGKRGAVVLTVQ